jgi:hypothetical protein
MSFRMGVGTRLRRERSMAERVEPPILRGMARAMRMMAMLAGLWLALAAVHAPQASSSTDEVRASSTLPDGAVVQRAQPPLHRLLHASHGAVLPAPIVLVNPPLARDFAGISHARSLLASRSGNLGARAPPV